jgi:small subunit ribosomal protein S20
VAHSLSSKKRIRQNIKRRGMNRSRRSALRTKLRKCSEVFLHGTVEEAEAAVRDASRTLDREASRRVLHPNAAARRKSRLVRRLRAMQAKATTE